MTLCKGGWAYGTLKASVTEDLHKAPVTEDLHVPTVIKTTELQILNT